MARLGITATLIGASSLAQLASNIAASDVTLSPAQMTRLDAASQPAMGFSASLTQPAIRRMVFGGNDVTGWAE